jgi:transcriptional regulator with XRE-family HTH domain
MTVKRHGLVRRRRALGFTQESLAEALGVERSTVRRWESAESAPIPFLRPRLARLLRVNAEELDELLTVTPGAAPSHTERVGYALRHPSGVDLLVAAELRSSMENLTARHDAVPSATLLAHAGSNSTKWHSLPMRPRLTACSANCALSRQTRQRSWAS